jgi:alpha-amylase
MHKKMMALSAMARRRRDGGAEVRRAIGRAQCNDAYWHGVFGGLYLPHLREAIWRNLAEAEAGMRRGQAIAWETLDLDGDGNDEIWVHSSAFSALVSPTRGAAVEEYTVFGRGINFADTLTRRREAYIDLALERAAEQNAAENEGTPSIHDIEEGLRLDERPPLDADDRALFVDRVLPRGVALEEYAGGGFWAIRSWARERAAVTVERRRGSVEIVCVLGDGPGRLEKRLRFEADGRLTVGWQWDSSVAEATDLFATELSLAAPVRLECTPTADEWRYVIETVAKSERGLDRTRQGDSVTLRWPVEVGAAGVVLTPAE